MSFYAGIDYSTMFVDVVLVDEDDRALADYRRFQLAGETAFERARSVGQQTDLFASDLWDDIVAVGIEDPFGGNPRSRQVVPKLKMVQGAIVAGLRSDLLVQPFSPNEWRSTVGLAGNCAKGVVARWAQLELGHLVDDNERPKKRWLQDGYDAYGLAIAVQRLVEERIAA